MKGSTLQQHKEATMLCEEGMITTETKNELSVPQNTKEVTLVKTQDNIGKTNKHCINCGMTNHNVETCKKKKE
jgi:orotate phosphoribosyltransferase-like protein